MKGVSSHADADFVRAENVRAEEHPALTGDPHSQSVLMFEYSGQH